MHKKKLHNKILPDFANLSTTELYHEYFLGQNIWFFSEYQSRTNFSDTYDLFKLEIADKLDIHFNNIAIVGSAKNGFSLNPANSFREFRPSTSDIDVIIVSPKDYNALWNAYQDMFYRGVTIDEYPNFTKHLFKGFFIMSNPTAKSKEIKDWIKKSDGMKANIQLKFSMLNQFNYRVYRSWEDVQKYHFRNVESLRTRAKKMLSSRSSLMTMLESLKQSKE